jgi:hypothetical protein
MLVAGASDDTPAAGQSDTRRLWSLWDIMKLFDAALLMKFMEAVGMTRALIQLREGLPLTRNLSLNDVSDGWVEEWLLLMNLYEKNCVEMELTASVSTIRKLRAALSKESPTPDDVVPLTTELGGRLYDEMHGRHFWSLTMSETAHYTNPHRGWEDAIKQLPTAAYDIEEASMCLVFGRSTASAFHSIRSLEAAIGALSRCLGIPDPTKAAGRNWGAVLKTIKTEIDRRWPTSTNRLSGDGEFFDLAYAGLAAMQNPYRNATMHLDFKYTPDEARHVFEVVRGFMQKIASRCDENGDPKA